MMSYPVFPRWVGHYGVVAQCAVGPCIGDPPAFKKPVPGIAGACPSKPDTKES